MSSSSSSSSSYPSTNSSTLGNASVQVVIRVRPMNESEKKHGTLPVITASTQEKSVTVIKGQGAKQVRTSYNFDNVFTSFSSQEEVFYGTLKPVISDVLRGYESTVFAYGQTGTGKTHTMEGDLSNADMQGIIPRSAKSIFEALKHPQFIDYKVTCSYLEIYNEELGDLLTCVNTMRSGERKASHATRLDIMEGKNGTFCRGLIEKEVNSLKDVFTLMHSAQHQRKVGETKMNKHSSRSHCIFTMRVQSKVRLDDGNGIMEYNGKLHMVDLAGSECAKTASLEKSCGSEIARERERMNINRSLLTLGRVISILKDQSCGKKSNSNARIPYRDSKLTRILQESLGGRCKTVVIATLSPSVTAIEESISTLNYAQSANGIVNKPISHSFLSITPGASISIPTQKTNVDGGQDTANSVDSWYEMECRLQYMQAQVEEAQAALARKHLQQQDLVERADKAESEKLEIERKLNETNNQIKCLEESLDKEKQDKRMVEEKLEETENSLRKTSLILKATKRTERLLTTEANTLIATLKDSISDGDILHKNLMDYQKEEEQTKVDARKFQQTSSVILNTSVQTLSELSTKLVEHLAIIQSSANNSKYSDEKFSQEIASFMNETTSTIMAVSDSVKNSISAEDGITSTLLGVSSNVKKCTNETSSQISKETETLIEITENTQVQLNKNISKIKKLSLMHEKSVNESMSTLEKNLSESNARLSQMIEHVMNAVDILQEKKALCRQKLRSIVEEETKESIDLANHSESIAKTNSLAVDGAMKGFTKQLLNLDNIDESLETQRQFLKEEGNSHVTNTEKQSAQIDIQQKLISSVCDQQMKLQSEVISNVMSGVNDLLNKQIESMRNETSELFTKYLVTSNNSIKGMNIDLEASAKNIVKKSEETNDYLNVAALDIRQKNLAFSKIVSTTKDCLNDIVDTSFQQQKGASLFHGKVDDIISLTTNLDTETENELENVVSTGKDLLLKSSANLLEDANNGFESINKVGYTLTKQSTDAFEFCAESLSAMKNPIDNTKMRAQNNEKEINLIASKGLDKIKDLTNKQYNVVNKSLDLVQSTENTLKNKMAEHEHQISQDHSELSNSVNELKNETKTCVPKCISNSNEMQGNIENFTSNALHCQDDAKEISPRNQLCYKEELSFTPSDSEIILNTSTLSALSDKENEADLSSERSLGSGSTCLSSPPMSPALRERTINKENSIKISSGKKGKADSARSRSSHLSRTSKRRNSARKVPTPQSLRKRPKVIPTSSFKSRRKNDSYF